MRTSEKRAFFWRSPTLNLPSWLRSCPPPFHKEMPLGFLPLTTVQACLLPAGYLSPDFACRHRGVFPASFPGLKGFTVYPSGWCGVALNQKRSSGSEGGRTRVQLILFQCSLYFSPFFLSEQVSHQVFPFLPSVFPPCFLETSKIFTQP